MEKIFRKSLEKGKRERKRRKNGLWQEQSSNGFKGIIATTRFLSVCSSCHSATLPRVHHVSMASSPGRKKRKGRSNGRHRVRWEGRETVVFEKYIWIIEARPWPRSNRRSFCFFLAIWVIVSFSLFAFLSSVLVSRICFRVSLIAALYKYCFLDALMLPLSFNPFNFVRSMTRVYEDLAHTRLYEMKTSSHQFELTIEEFKVARSYKIMSYGVYDFFPLFNFVSY